MFKIEMFCDDKNLPKILTAVTGLALGVPKAVPVVNAEHKNGQLKARTSGDVPALFSAWAKKHHLAEVNASAMREFATAHGWSPGSYSSLLTKVVKAKVVRKIGKGTHSKYKIVAEA
jgi:hypothetical protein